MIRKVNRYERTNTAFSAQKNKNNRRNNRENNRRKKGVERKSSVAPMFYGLSPKSARDLLAFPSNYAHACRCARLGRAFRSSP